MMTPAATATLGRRYRLEERTLSSTEQPRIAWFELEICIFQLRLAVVPGRSILFGFKSEDGQINSTELRYEGNEQLAESLLQSLHWLVLANGILDTPETMPTAVFRMRAMKAPSVHLRIAYADGRKWSSMYLPAEVPANVQAFIEQARYLAEQEFKKPAQATPAEAKPWLCSSVCCA